MPFDWNLQNFDDDTYKYDAYSQSFFLFSISLRQFGVCGTSFGLAVIEL